MPGGRNKAETPVRRFLHGASKEGQSNKKCSISSMPSLVGHIGLIVSLKLCLHLWKFNLLRPTLSPKFPVLTPLWISRGLWYTACTATFCGSLQEYNGQQGCRRGCSNRPFEGF